MAARIAVFLTGKHKPTYRANKKDQGDICVVVNAGDVKVTGKKRYLKMYRYHTGYPGGLKEATMKDVLNRDPERIIYEAVYGMLPKNKLRKE